MTNKKNRVKIQLSFQIPIFPTARKGTAAQRLGGVALRMRGELSEAKAGLCRGLHQAQKTKGKKHLLQIDVTLTHQGRHPSLCVIPEKSFELF